MPLVTPQLRPALLRRGFLPAFAPLTQVRRRGPAKFQRLGAVTLPKIEGRKIRIWYRDDCLGVDTIENVMKKHLRPGVMLSIRWSLSQELKQELGLPLTRKNKKPTASETDTDITTETTPETLSETTTPETITLETIAEATTTEATTTEATTPETTPETTLETDPKSTTPEPILETTAPETATPEATTPETAIPETTTPETTTPETTGQTPQSPILDYQLSQLDIKHSPFAKGKKFNTTKITLIRLRGNMDTKTFRRWIWVAQAALRQSRPVYITVSWIDKKRKGLDRRLPLNIDQRLDLHPLVILRTMPEDSQIRLVKGEPDLGVVVFLVQPKVSLPWLTEGMEPAANPTLTVPVDPGSEFTDGPASHWDVTSSEFFDDGKSRKKARRHFHPSKSARSSWKSSRSDKSPEDSKSDWKSSRSFTSPRDSNARFEYPEGLSFRKDFKLPHSWKPPSEFPEGFKSGIQSPEGFKSRGGSKSRFGSSEGFKSKKSFESRFESPEGFKSRESFKSPRGSKSRKGVKPPQEASWEKPGSE